MLRNVRRDHQKSIKSISDEDERRVMGKAIDEEFSKFAESLDKLQNKNKSCV